MPDNDPDQIKLTEWWHNNMSETRYTLEVMQSLMDKGLAFIISQKKGSSCVEIHDETKEACPCWYGTGWNFYEAFWKAKEAYDLRSGEDPGNVAESCESAPEQVEVEMAKGVGGVKGVLGVSILSK